MGCSHLNGCKKKNMSYQKSSLRGLAPDFIRSEVIFRVDALKIVEAHVLSDRILKLRRSSVMSMIQTFGLERTKEVFHDNVVERPTRSGHGG